MQKFKGFSPGQQKTIPLVIEFFMELVPLVDDIAELKVILFAFRALYQKEGAVRFLRWRDFLSGEELRRSIDSDEALRAAVNRAVEREALLSVSIPLENNTENLYFLNTPHSRTTVEQIRSGQWRPDKDALNIEILPERPNIFALYEANIGILTPLLADALKNAEEDYPLLWIEEAIKLSTEQNKRSWSYIQAILERWKREGKNSHEKTGRHHGGDTYTPGQYDEYFKS